MTRKVLLYVFLWNLPWISYYSKDGWQQHEMSAKLTDSVRFELRNSQLNRLCSENMYPSFEFQFELFELSGSAVSDFCRHLNGDLSGENQWPKQTVSWNLKHSRGFLVRQLWIVNYCQLFVKYFSVHRVNLNLSYENINTGVSREIIFQK